MAAVTTVEDERSLYFAAVPPLAWMAAFAALADLLINRVAIPLGVDAWSSGALARVDGAGGFARNLSVISALVALSFCLASISSPKSGLPFSARAGVASFGWVLIPIVTMMTFLPRAMTRVELVLALAGLAHALILLLILAGIHLRPTRAASAALVLTLVATFSGILSLMVSLVGERTYWEHAERLSNAFRWSGELAYLAIPLAIGFAIAIPWRDARGKATLLVAGLAAGLVTGGMASWKHAVGRELPDLLYGAVRLDFLPDRDLILYAIPLSVGSAVTVAAMLSKDPVRRQLGAALLLLLSAGYTPRSPSTLIVTVLGVALLSRAGIALAQRRREH
ncbi:MAG: hypothetical protein JRI98_08885 [Deltaproteobacteria bacterium]|nr:hypothetical protein [Deltaproteobacteria bacterium]